jgi:peptide/nickel transport system permease protein
MATTVTTPTPIKALALASNKGWWNSKAMKRFRRNPLGIIGFLIIVFFIGVAILAPVLTYSQLENYRNRCVRDLGLSSETVSDLRNPLKLVFWRAIIFSPASCYDVPQNGRSQVPKAPAEFSPMGTASGGYDIYYGLVWGTRTAFLSAIAVTGFGLLLGIVIGSISGFFGGWIDTFIMRLIEVLSSIPGIILAMVIIAIYGQSLRNVLISLAVLAWTGYARFLRGEILRVRELEYVDGARALGAGNSRLIFKHVLPNSIGSLLILASLDIGTVTLSVAALGFLGLGAQPGYADWGQMINFAKAWITGLPGEPFAYWYVIFWPGFIILLFVLGWNLLGDAVRDVLDVRS